MPTTDYLASIERELQTGNATEHSYRPMLRQFLVDWSQGFSPSTDYTITNEPQTCRGEMPLIFLFGAERYPWDGLRQNRQERI